MNYKTEEKLSILSIMESGEGQLEKGKLEGKLEAIKGKKGKKTPGSGLANLDRFLLED